MKRRDLIDGTKLLKRHKIEVNEIAAGLAATYLSDRRDGEEAAQVPFDQWLDADLNDDEVAALAAGSEGEEQDPTPPTSTQSAQPSASTTT
jgi:hypothetical protein